MSCPVCSDEGDSFAGTAKAETWHYFARTIWALHKTRQAADADGQRQMSAFLSGVINDMERAFSRLYSDGRH